MKYVLLDNNQAKEIIPSENPAFPGVPIEKRYAPDFVSQLIPVEDDVEVKQGWVYDPESNTFSEPVQDSEPDADPEPPEQEYQVSQSEAEAAYREGVNAYE